MSADRVPPVAAGECSPEWIAERRAIIVRDGYALRAGSACAIEIKSLTTNEWFRLTLPGGALAFTTEPGRDAVLALLQGEPCRP